MFLSVLGLASLSCEVLAQTHRHYFNPFFFFLPDFLFAEQVLSLRKNFSKTLPPVPTREFKGINYMPCVSELCLHPDANEPSERSRNPGCVRMV